MLTWGPTEPGAPSFEEKEAGQVSTGRFKVHGPVLPRLEISEGSQLYFCWTFLYFSLPIQKDFHHELDLIVMGLQISPHPLTSKGYKGNKKARFIREYYLLGYYGFSFGGQKWTFIV